MRTWYFELVFQDFCLGRAKVGTKFSIVATLVASLHGKTTHRLS